MDVTPQLDFNIEFVQGGMKTAMREQDAKSRDLLMVPIDNIKPPANFNVRIRDEEYEAHIEDIKDSILENGFYPHMPLSGYACKEGEQTFIYLTGGFSRFEAAQRAKAAGAPIEALPMVLKPPGTSMADLMVALAQDNTGAPLKPYEKAIVVKRLLGYGMDEKTIATKLGISGQYVRDLLFLTGLPNTLQQMVIRGEAGAGVVISTARKHGTDAVKVLQDSMVDVGGAKTLPPPTGETADAATVEDDTPTPAPRKRVSPARAAAGGADKTPAKKTILAAIDYAIALPGNGIEFLDRWRKGEADAVAEVVSFVKDSKPKRAAAKPKAKVDKKKPGRKKKKTVKQYTADDIDI